MFEKHLQACAEDTPLLELERSEYEVSWCGVWRNLERLLCPFAYGRGSRIACPTGEGVLFGGDGGR